MEFFMDLFISIVLAIYILLIGLLIWIIWQCLFSVKLKLQTPRSIDNIAIKKKELMKESPEMETDPTVLFTLIE